MVSVLCLIIALPLVANSAFSAPITTADLIDPHRVDADCANYDEQNGTHGGGQGEEVDDSGVLGGSRSLFPPLVLLVWV